ncbi:MAG: DUF6428 family protein [Flavobacteriaceae bacterium]
MSTQELLSILQDHSDKSLLFEYEENAFVEANYHITEVKNITVDSVDCGSGTGYWKETVIQLWESPKEKGKKDFMSAYKALAILNKVHRIKPMDLEAEVKFEYSNSSFHTAQLFVADHTYTDQRLVLKLAINKTDCKAKEACETPKTETVRCAPESGCC